MSTTTTENPNIDPKDQRIKELEAKLSQMQSQHDQMNEAMGKMGVVVDVIAKDPELTKQLQVAIQKNYNIQPEDKPEDTKPENKPQDKPVDPKKSALEDPHVMGIDAKLRQDVIRRIESKYGVDRMTADQKKAIRQQVESKMGEWGTSVLKAPVNELENKLEDAYFLTNVGRAKEEGKIEGLIEAHMNDLAAIPNMPSNSTEQGEAELSAEHKTWAQKLDVPLDKVQANLKQIQEKGVITMPVEAKNSQQKTPSGAPSNAPTS